MSEEPKKRGRPIKYLVSEAERNDKKLMRKIYNQTVYLERKRKIEEWNKLQSLKN